jgi:hypothetical protein
VSVLDTCFLVPGLTKAECASWVQAWGSIAAIVAATGVVLLQHVLERRRTAEAQRESDKRLLRLAHSVAREAQQIAFHIGAFRSDSSNNETAQQRHGFREDLELSLQSIRAILFMQLPTPSAVSSALRVQGEIQRALKLVDSVRELGSGDFTISCSETYGQPWISIHAHLRDQVDYLNWEMRRVDNPTLPHPAD